MSIALPLLVLALVVVAAVLVARLVLQGSPGPDALPLPERVARHARRTRWVPPTAGLLAAVVLLAAQPALSSRVARAVGPDGPTGLVLALVPLAVGLVWVGATAVAERTWPAPDGELRHAALAPRSVATTSPRLLRVLTATWGGLLVAVLVTCAIVGDGNSLVVTSGPVTTSAGPFAGWAYGAPMLAAALALAGLTVLTLRLVRRRPAVPSITPEQDADLRRRTTGGALRVAQAAFGLTLGGTTLVAGVAVHGVTSGLTLNGEPAPAWGALAPWLVGAAWLVLLLAIAATVPWPARAARAAYPAGVPA